MTKIFYDHQIFSSQRYGGISRYFEYLMCGIEESERVDYKLGVLKSNNYYIRNEKQLLSNSIFNPLFKTTADLIKRNNSYCKYLLKKDNFSIFHPTYYSPYFLKYLKKPLVITIHDMTYEALPQFFLSDDPIPYYKRLLMERADKIIAISETTKQDILKYSKISEGKIEVIYHGMDLNTPKYEDIPTLPKEYILFVGARWSYKNFHMVANAFKILSTKYNDLQLVLAGGGPLSYGDSEFLMRNNILDKTVQISATDEQLNTIYKNALCFIYPSLYEGFGLPILEAFKNNCPVLLSDCSCFQEIAGDAANYFDHKSLESLVNEIEKMIINKSFASNFVLNGNSKLLEYPIEKCVSKTINFYRSISDYTMQ